MSPDPHDERIRRMESRVDLLEHALADMARADAAAERNEEKREQVWDKRFDRIVEAWNQRHTETLAAWDRRFEKAEKRLAVLDKFMWTLLGVGGFNAITLIVERFKQ